MPDITVERFLLFAALVFPGFVSWFGYALRVPQKDTYLKDRIFEASAFSITNFALFVWPAYQLELFSTALSYGLAASWLAAVVAFAVGPFAIGWFGASLTSWAASHGWAVSPTKSAFDWVFQSRQGCWLKVQLNDGKWVGGRFDRGTRSFASAYPDSGHLFIGELWELDEAGAFKERMKDSPGLIVRPTEYKLIWVYMNEEELA
jgi:hypothetical protein